MATSAAAVSSPPPRHVHALTCPCRNIQLYGSHAWTTAVSPVAQHLGDVDGADAVDAAVRAAFPIVAAVAQSLSLSLSLSPSLSPSPSPPPSSSLPVTAVLEHDVVCKVAPLCTVADVRLEPCAAVSSSSSSSSSSRWQAQAVACAACGVVCGLRLSTSPWQFDGVASRSDSDPPTVVFVAAPAPLVHCTTLERATRAPTAAFVDGVGVVLPELPPTTPATASSLVPTVDAADATADVGAAAAGVVEAAVARAAADRDAALQAATAAITATYDATVQAVTAALPRVEYQLRCAARRQEAVRASLARVCDTPPPKPPSPAATAPIPIPLRVRAVSADSLRSDSGTATATAPSDDGDNGGDSDGRADGSLSPSSTASSSSSSSSSSSPPPPPSVHSNAADAPPAVRYIPWHDDEVFDVGLDEDVATASASCPPRSHLRAAAAAAAGGGDGNASTGGRFACRRRPRLAPEDRGARAFPTLPSTFSEAVQFGGRGRLSSTPTSGGDGVSPPFQSALLDVVEEAVADSGGYDHGATTSSDDGGDERPAAGIAATGRSRSRAFLDGDTASAAPIPRHRVLYQAAVAMKPPYGTSVPIPVPGMQAAAAALGRTPASAVPAVQPSTAAYAPASVGAGVRAAARGSSGGVPIPRRTHGRGGSTSGRGAPGRIVATPSLGLDKDMASSLMLLNMDKYGPPAS